MQGPAASRLRFRPQTGSQKHTMTPASITLGHSDLRIAPLGLGTWQWGDSSTWGYGTGHTRADIVAAFWASINAGITLLDTAEIYGNGVSETLVGRLARTTDQPLVLASKY